ncbi:MAG: NAD(P)-dependent oxidoreductase [Elusimicrobia bacterium]|nr:NAD(P)-dependent oxidoreductase [Elusimicrobiota bacterium]
MGKAVDRSPSAPESAPKDVFAKFADISPAMRPEEAAVEANRCLYCYDAPCIQACPTHIEIPRFIKQIASKNLTGSAKTILEANALGHSCARICPVEVLCEGACVYLDWHEKPIQIARLQRHATDALHAKGKRPFQAGRDNGRKVAIVGAGPAGLACAFYLRRLGHPVTIFEKSELPGGLNTTGIAEYKMTRATSLEEARSVIEMGVDVRYGVEVGKDVPVEKLEREFEAVFIGIGLGETRSLRLDGERLPGVWDALTFANHIKARDAAPLGKSKTTIVIGAGNTAIDAVTQAKRLGAERVIMAYRREAQHMTAYDYEFELAKADEIEFLWNASPLAILGDKQVTGMRFARTRALPDGGLEAVPGSEFEIACDRVIKAIGQTKHYSLAKGANLRLSQDGRIEVDPISLRASNPRYYAGGDAVNGGREVVNAAADGKRAAWNIHKSLCRVTEPPDGHAYWIDTIDVRRVAPIPERGHGAEAGQAETANGDGGKSRPRKKR